MRNGMFEPFKSGKMTDTQIWAGLYYETESTLCRVVKLNHLGCFLNRLLTLTSTFLCSRCIRWAGWLLGGSAPPCRWLPRLASGRGWRGPAGWGRAGPDRDRGRSRRGRGSRWDRGSRRSALPSPSSPCCRRASARGGCCPPRRSACPPRGEPPPPGSPPAARALSAVRGSARRAGSGGLAEGQRGASGCAGRFGGGGAARGRGRPGLGLPGGRVRTVAGTAARVLPAALLLAWVPPAAGCGGVETDPQRFSSHAGVFKTPHGDNSA